MTSTRGGSPIEIPLLVPDHSRVWARSVVPAFEAVQHSLLARPVQHEDNSAAVITTNAATSAGCSVEVALGILDQSRFGVPSVGIIGEVVQHGFLPRRVHLKHCSAAVGRTV